jgi:signal transduction histidine kinase
VPSDPPWLRLTIRDEGLGFDLAQQRPPESMGLDGMEARAATVGGRLRVQSAPGAGTTVILEVPAT